MSEQVVLVTGGGGNVGRVVTRAFLESGARVAVPLYKTDAVEVLEALRGEFGDRVHHFALDLTTERGAEAAVRDVAEWGGRLDTVVHMMGGYKGGARIADTPVELWEHMMDLNLKSAWLITRAALPQMLQGGGGSFVFVSARAAQEPRGGDSAYAISKAALRTLAASVAKEYRAERIRANAILPGTVDTAANRQRMPDADRESWTTPEEIARVILFLTSPASAAINGTAIAVDGRR